MRTNHPPKDRPTDGSDWRPGRTLERTDLGTPFPGRHSPEQERAFERAETIMATGPVRMARRIMELEDALEAEHEERCGCEHPGSTDYCIVGLNFAVLAANPSKEETQ
jgi:hypothetical protein